MAARAMDTTRYIFFPVATYSMITNTLNSTVATVRPAATARAHGATDRLKPTSAAPKIVASDGPRAAKVTAQPPIPTTSPSGTPMAATISASSATARRSCRREAPTEAKSPNWPVRSATEMAKAL